MRHLGDGHVTHPSDTRQNALLGAGVPDVHQGLLRLLLRKVGDGVGRGLDETLQCDGSHRASSFLGTAPFTMKDV